jgi:hypothetical protein
MARVNQQRERRYVGTNSHGNQGYVTVPKSKIPDAPRPQRGRHPFAESRRRVTHARKRNSWRKPSPTFDGKQPQRPGADTKIVKIGEDTAPRTAAIRKAIRSAIVSVPQAGKLKGGSASGAIGQDWVRRRAVPQCRAGSAALPCSPVPIQNLGVTLGAVTGAFPWRLAAVTQGCVQFHHCAAGCLAVRRSATVVSRGASHQRAVQNGILINCSASLGRHWERDSFDSVSLLFRLDFS